MSAGAKRVEEYANQEAAVYAQWLHSGNSTGHLSEHAIEALEKHFRHVITHALEMGTFTSEVTDLVWSKLYPQHTFWPMDWHGTGILRSRYVVTQSHKGASYYVLGRAYETLDEAKSAAQADYERCVLSALAPSSSTGEAA